MKEWKGVTLPELPDKYFWDAIDDDLSVYFRHEPPCPEYGPVELVVYINKYKRIVYQGIGTKLNKRFSANTAEEAVAMVFGRLLLGEWDE